MKFIPHISAFLCRVSFYLVGVALFLGSCDKGGQASNSRINLLKKLHPNLAPASDSKFKVSCWLFADAYERATQKILPPPLDRDCKLLTLEYNKNWRSIFSARSDATDKALADVAEHVFETVCYAYKNTHLPPKEAWLDQTKNKLLRIEDKVVPTPEIIKKGLLQLLNDFREVADPERFWSERKHES